MVLRHVVLPQPDAGDLEGFQRLDVEGRHSLSEELASLLRDPLDAVGYVRVRVVAYWLGCRRSFFGILISFLESNDSDTGKYIYHIPSLTLPNVESKTKKMSILANLKQQIVLFSAVAIPLQGKDLSLIFYTLSGLLHPPFFLWKYLPIVSIVLLTANNVTLTNYLKREFSKINVKTYVNHYYLHLPSHSCSAVFRTHSPHILLSILKLTSTDPCRTFFL